MDIEGKRPHVVKEKSEVVNVNGRIRATPSHSCADHRIHLYCFRFDSGAAIFMKMTMVDVRASQPDATKYQAVFMTNGQVYFARWGIRHCAIKR